MDIRILPSNIANMIAAGEVVQRPASVVKELMENAVDAGADNVSVIIQDSGRTLIQVIDNGCGMSPDQAVLAFERHATSKLSCADDLNNILTFGFRGEALASIAAVAEVTLKTRREEDEMGVKVSFADSKHIDTEPVAAPKGSNFAVRNLFYNVPARRKFLKSDTIEFKHIVSEFTRVALTRPDITFTLNHNGKDVSVLKVAKSLKFRILDMLGGNVVNDVVDVHVETSVVRIDGYVGRPESAKKALGNQYFFVNGRYFRSPYLHKAVMKAYENLVTEGVTPSYFLYLRVDPHSLDVNIHPTKTEIKFEDDNVIFQVLSACIRETLGRNSFGASIDFEREGVPDIPVFSRNFEEFRQVSEPAIGRDASYNPFDSDGFPSEPYPAQPSSTYVPEKQQDYGKLFDDKLVPTCSILLLKGKYILTSASSGIMAVNVSRAMERIMYERFMDELSRGDNATQTVLFPVTVQVGAEQMCLFSEHSALLSSLGFDIAPFGVDTIVVRGVPEGYSAEEGRVQAMISDLMLILSEDHTALGPMMQSNIASRLARLGALNADFPTDQAQAQNLIDRLFACNNSEFTSSGKRILAIIPFADIDKYF